MHNLKFYLFVLLLGILFTSCEKDDPNIIDPTLSFPTVTSSHVTPVSFDTVYLSGTVWASVTSALPITKVTARILNPSGTVVTSLDLKDNGVAPDSVAGDGTYSAALGFLLDCKYVGTYTVQVVATNSSGLNSGPSNATFTMTNVNNHKPFLTDVICPADIRRPTGIGADTIPGIAFLQVFAHDPDGNCDINRAYFNSYSPTGFPNTHNPFDMYDDGDILGHGDTIAGDNRYSLLVQIPGNPSDTSIGNFTFKFNAWDQQHLASDTVTKIINVHR